ncbi:MAG: tetratricopeptide repeat protein, partial [Myxococcales bacterium]|nr:tetratricopeptide repeat protein [Myxococcales bacterium]
AQLALDAGRIAEAETSVRRAEALPRGVDAAIALDLASADLARARSDVIGAEAHQRQALERCLAHGRPTGRAWLGLCASFLDRGDLSGAGEAGRAAVEALRHTGDAALTIALSNLAVAVRRSGRPAEARALLLEAEAVDRRVGAVANLASDLANLAILDAHEGHLEASLATFQASIDGFLACGMRGAGAQQRSNLAEVSMIVGRVEEARRSAQLALEVHEELGQHRLIGHALHLLATLATSDGATDEARALLIRARGHHERARSPGVALVDLELAFLALREGRLDEATALAEAAVSALEGHAADRALALAARGEARAAAGHPGARADLDEAVATLRRVSPTSAPRALCALARATRDPSVLDAAERDPDTWTVRQGSPMAQEVARTRRLLGGATVRG